jgi:signal recognition particle subunit SRP54
MTGAPTSGPASRHLLREDGALADSNQASRFTLDDLRKLLDQAGRPAPPDQWMSTSPGLEALSEGMREAEQHEMDRLKGIVDSMTPQERRDPVSLISESRARRIAAGAGVATEEVIHLVKQFRAMADIMNHLARQRPPWGPAR